MKKTYTKRQITEAIAYWKKQLKKMNEELIQDYHLSFLDDRVEIGAIGYYPDTFFPKLKDRIFDHIHNVTGANIADFFNNTNADNTENTTMPLFDYVYSDLFDNINNGITIEQKWWETLIPALIAVSDAIRNKIKPDFKRIKNDLNVRMRQIHTQFMNIREIDLDAFDKRHGDDHGTDFLGYINNVAGFFTSLLEDFWVWYVSAPKTYTVTYEYWNKMKEDAEIEAIDENDAKRKFLDTECIEDEYRRDFEILTVKCN